METISPDQNISSGDLSLERAVHCKVSGEAKQLVLGWNTHPPSISTPSSPAVSLSCSSAVLVPPRPSLCPGRRTSERRSARCSQPSQLFPSEGSLVFHHCTMAQAMKLRKLRFAKSAQK